jgi:hypothetical protein
MNASQWFPTNLRDQLEQDSFSSDWLVIIFETVRIGTSICSVLGLLGNIALICVIATTSFRHVSYGLLIVIIALFDSIRLLSGIYYYCLFADIIPMNSVTETIYVAIDRYPIFVVNWCKVRLTPCLFSLTMASVSVASHGY